MTAWEAVLALVEGVRVLVQSFGLIALAVAALCGVSWYLWTLLVFAVGG